MCNQYSKAYTLTSNVFYSSQLFVLKAAILPMDTAMILEGVIVCRNGLDETVTRA